MIWYQKSSGDLILRAGGVAMLYGAWLLGNILKMSVLQHAEHEVMALDLLTGMIMFNLAAFGAAALILGKHLFDKVAISDRWIARRTRDYPMRQAA